jgi:hypothetical protein
VAGLYDFSAIKAYLARELSADPTTREAAAIGVYNGSLIEGAAARVATELRSENLNAAAIGNAPDQTAAYRIYDLGNGQKPATAKKLAELYHVEVTPATEADLPEGVHFDKDFVIIIGSDVGAN